MIRAVVVASLLSVALLVASASTASAHPLGNFTINHYAGLVVRPDAVVIDYVLDYAEIPTVQLRSGIQGNERQVCAAVTGGLELRVDGGAVVLDVVAQGLSFPPGQAGLDIMRLECRLRSAIALRGETHTLAFSDTNYAERIGWREITAQGEGTALQTDLPRESVSARLTAYPQDLFASPLDVRAAELRFTVTMAAPSGEGILDTVLPAVISRPTDALASLITRADLGVLGLLLAIVVAFGLGALHALTPGHGKTVMAAYLVGSRGSLQQAAVLGLAVAASHTAGVLCLGIITLTGTALIAPDRVYPYLSAVSAGIVLVLGVWLVGARVRHRLAPAHQHTHAHPHDAPRLLSWRALAALGLAGGIIPSASALLVLLGAINLHRVELGLVLIVAFGLGMAVTLVGIGTALVSAGRLGEARLASHAALLRLYAYVPAAAAVAVLLLGIGMTAQSLAALARP